MNGLRRLLSHPRAAVVGHDLFMVGISWGFTLWLSGLVSGSELAVTGSTATVLNLLIVLAVQGAILWAMGLYKGLWRFASFRDMWNIVKAAAVGSLLVFAALSISGRYSLQALWPWAAVYPAALFITLALPRICYRIWKDSRLPLAETTAGDKRVLVLGAGRSGALLERELRHRGGYAVVGFLDDDPRLLGAQVHGLPVLGPIDTLPRQVREKSIQMAMIAIPSATNQQMQRIVRVCEDSGVEFRTLPILQDLGNLATRIGVLKKVVIDDLLGREPISLDWNSMREGLSGKRVMITGGGGSIGSEICRQIARLNPVELVVVDNGEYALYRIDMELRAEFRDLVFSSVLGDICDSATVEKVISEYKPDVIFHAAAYKHLPILQTQIREALRNNVIGTMRLAEAADRHGVGTFVLISTDKAVNPANIMGATKRVAEMYCQGLQGHSNTRFITVRFGNVLNSNGSVVPLFQEQIEKGGPITVTHPEISRYFMTIAEASQLIMQAALLGQGGEIYVLDMGEPVKITYLAEQLIRLAGMEPGRDIQIVYTGLRPGEKLFEELFHELEPYDLTTHEKIFLAHPRQVDWNELNADLHKLEQAVKAYDTRKLQLLLNGLVPELARSDPRQEAGRVVHLHRPA